MIQIVKNIELVQIKFWQINTARVTKKKKDYPGILSI